jgi:hypothetical protein
MKKTTILLAILLTLVSVGAYAQPGGYENPADDPTWGDGGGGQTCTMGCYGSPTTGYHCTEPYPLAGPGQTAVAMYSYCVPHNPCLDCQGPAYCEVGGRCWGHISSSAQSLGAEQQIMGITEFLRESKLPNGSPTISASDLDDFIAFTDAALEKQPYQAALQARLASYRAKFATLVGRELKPGHIPVLPHKPMKAPASTIAAR